MALPTQLVREGSIKRGWGWCVCVSVWCLGFVWRFGVCGMGRPVESSLEEQAIVGWGMHFMIEGQDGEKWCRPGNGHGLDGSG